MLTIRWHDFAAAVALFLVFEGIFPFINPGRLRNSLLALSQLSDRHLRFAGITSMLLGLLLLSLLN